MKKIKQIFSAGIISLAVIFSGGAVMADHSPDKEMVVVEKGDTLYALARKYHMSVARILELNHLDGTTIYPGQRLILSEDEDVYHKIMAGSFSKKENAVNRVSQLQKKELPAGLSTIVIKGKTHYRVQAGAFKNKKNAEKQLKAVKTAGIKDAYILAEKPLQIFGLAPGDAYEDIKFRMGEPKKTETHLNIESYYYQNDGAGVRVTKNMKDGTIGSLAVYPEYLSERMFPAMPFTKEQVIEEYGQVNKTEAVICYESAKCEELTYQLDNHELKVRIDRDGSTVQFLELTNLIYR
ncbi:LysM peptidoglycan-binding domain-containing protein [Bacillus sp. ISL-47]|uniref:LysM peptidoglycan-binding domain-containing protein n=1 Tax=Bacillus sp. ISL-47 TaxID=2819130 RepID=UPI001BE51558|nr:LysM peptidoglycan-binding domain-containing protein [Bacillus sp. ISL-47]MBT2686667.1 LysM peptidoglycan-binding domain-containing protein [Bacillus sp. ISL-47]MBT2707059.1 LysM peptidoglycan-binding domain-containing protein [Pseudomonas sp. ISL-84]